MVAVILSLGGFAALLLADLAKPASLSASLPVGGGRRALVALLSVAGYASVAAGLAVQLLAWGPPGAPSGLRLASLAAASPFLLLLLYSVFLEIPLRRRLSGAPRGALYRRGSYALCRHPGLLWFLLAHAALNLVYRSPDFLLISLAMVAGDLALVLAQDTWLFPRRFAGYDGYRRAVPFLLPQPWRS